MNGDVCVEYFPSTTVINSNMVSPSHTKDRNCDVGTLATTSFMTAPQNKLRRAQQGASPNGLTPVCALGRSAKMKSFLYALASLMMAIAPTQAEDADDLSGVSISPFGLSWFIQVSPDGSVRANYGSLPQHQIQMRQASIDFPKLIEEINNVITDEIIPGGTQVALMRRGEISSRSRYLREDEFIRKLFPSDPTVWKTILPKLTKDMKPDGLHIEPISKEMVDLLARNPIFPKKKAEQAGTGQPATRTESKPEGGDKPQPESEGRSR